MPVAGPTPGTKLNAVSDVITRAQFLLNDTGAQIWNLAALLGHLRSAYSWMANELMRACDVSFEKVLPDIPYTPGTAGQEQDLVALQPSDMYFPITVEFRLTTNEEWQPVDRRDVLPSRVTQQTDRLYEWEWRNRSIFVNPSTNSGFLRFRYMALLPTLTAGADLILLDNVLEALAYYTAADAYRRRGQHTQATAMMGSEVPPTGAIGFMSQVVAQCILNDQMVSRRGKRFSQTGVDIVTSRFSG
jgi:hypothetical protein